MRIVYLHQYFKTPNMSGGSRSFEMARRFVEQGHEVHMVTSAQKAEGAGKWYRTEEAGIHVHWLPVPYSNHMSFARRMMAFAQFAAKAPWKAGGIEADVVFATSTPLTICLPAIYAARKLGVPMVFEVRDLWPELPIAMGALRDPLLIASARQLERFAYRNASHVVALSPGMRDGVAATGFPESRIHVIPNSCDLEIFRAPEGGAEPFLAEHPHLRGKRLVTYAGTLGLINGVGYLVDVAAAMKARRADVHFLIVGDGKERDAITARAREAGVLGVNLDMIAPVAKSRMPNVLAATTVATSLFIPEPAMRHNSANKFFDALAAGKPVMINYEGWQADLLRDTGAGIVAPERNPVGAADRLCELLEDGESLARASKAAASLATSNFSRDQLAQRLLQVLHTAAREGRAGTRTANSTAVRAGV